MIKLTDDQYEACHELEVALRRCAEAFGWVHPGEVVLDFASVMAVGDLDHEGDPTYIVLGSPGQLPHATEGLLSYGSDWSGVRDDD